MIALTLAVFSIYCLVLALLFSRQDRRFAGEIQEERLKLARLEGVISGIQSERIQ